MKSRWGSEEESQYVHLVLQSNIRRRKRSTIKEKLLRVRTISYYYDQRKLAEEETTAGTLYFLALAVEFMVVLLFLILLIWPRTKNWTIYITVKPMMMQVISPRKLRKKNKKWCASGYDRILISILFRFPKKLSFHDIHMYPDLFSLWHTIIWGFADLIWIFLKY